VRPYFLRIALGMVKISVKPSGSSGISVRETRGVVDSAYAERIALHKACRVQREDIAKFKVDI